KKVYPFPFVGENFLVVAVALPYQAALRFPQQYVPHCSVVHFIKHRVDKVGTSGIEYVRYGGATARRVDCCGNLITEVALRGQVTAEALARLPYIGCVKNGERLAPLHHRIAVLNLVFDPRKFALLPEFEIVDLARVFFRYRTDSSVKISFCLCFLLYECFAIVMFSAGVVKPKVGYYAKQFAVGTLHI